MFPVEKFPPPPCAVLPVIIYGIWSPYGLNIRKANNIFQSICFGCAVLYSAYTKVVTPNSSEGSDLRCSERHSTGPPWCRALSARALMTNTFMNIISCITSASNISITMYYYYYPSRLNSFLGSQILTFKTVQALCIALVGCCRHTAGNLSGFQIYPFVARGEHGLGLRLKMASVMALHPELIGVLSYPHLCRNQT